MQKLKLSFTLLVIIVTASSFFATKLFATAGQWSYSGSTIYYNDGNLGLGTTTPNDPLVVNNTSTQIGKVLVGDGVGSWWIQGSTNSGQGMNNIASNSYFNGSSWQRRVTNSEGWIISDYVTNNNSGYFKIWHADASTGALTTYFSINGAGTTFAKAITVNAAAWGDNVFNKDYDLKSLSQVESYINENNHLPNVPSEAEVLKNGIDVADMQKTQMQKIEELTLYAIQQDKKINDLEARLEKLESLIVSK